MADEHTVREGKFIEVQEKKAEEKKIEEQLKEEQKGAPKAQEKAAGEKKEEKKTLGKDEKKEEKKAIGKEEKKPEVKKEEPKKAEKPEEKKREIVSERLYVVPLRDAYSKPLMKRGNVAIRLLKEFLTRHMKASEGKIKLSMSLNNLIRKRGSGRPLKKVKVKATKDKEGVVFAEPAA